MQNASTQEFLIEISGQGANHHLSHTQKYREFAVLVQACILLFNYRNHPCYKNYFQFQKSRNTKAHAGQK